MTVFASNARIVVNDCRCGLTKKNRWIITSIPRPKATSIVNLVRHKASTREKVITNHISAKQQCVYLATCPCQCHTSTWSMDTDKIPARDALDTSAPAVANVSLRTITKTQRRRLTIFSISSKTLRVVLAEIRGWFHKTESTRLTTVTTRLYALLVDSKCPL